VELTFYKLRDNLEDGDWGLRSVVSEYSLVPVREIPGVVIQLYVRMSKVNIPRWQEDLMLIALDQHSEFLKGLRNQSTGALLLIERQGQRYILVYGSGRHAVDPNKIEVGFGLRVAANVVDPEALKGVDTRSIIGSGRSQVVSMPSVGPLYRLGIEPTVDLVRSLEGKPPEEFANGIAGGDVLRLTLKSFSFNNLPQKLDEITAAYDSEAYRESFPFLDYFTRVPRTSSEIRMKLYAEVEELILSGSRDIDFMNPDLDRQDKPERFVLKSGRRVSPDLAELDRETILSLVADWGVTNPMKSLQVHAYYEGVEQPYSSSLLPYIVTEIHLGNRIYAPCAGAWYRVDKDHLQGLQERINQLPDLTSALSLPPWHKGYANEADYNNETHPRNEVPVVLDKALFYNRGGRNLKVEVCDLLTRHKELICVKKMKDSATLSHLFAQGSVSAQLTRDNARYRSTLLDHFRKLAPDSSIGPPSDWTIVFAVATDRPGRVADSLFFFSKVNLEIAARAIQSAGMRVALAKINNT
jgi:uncharacterized protein (TIGR04141 family)